MKFLSDLLVEGDGNEIFLKSADHNISRIIPRGTGANLDKGLFSLFDTGTEDVRIDTAGVSWFNGGNIGIGTSTPASALTIKGDSPYIRLERAGVTTWEIRQNYPATEYGFQIVNVTSGTIPFFVGASNNVGIGTTSPSQKLHVSGGHILLDNNKEIRQKDSGGTERTVFELDSSNDLNIGGSYAGALKFIGGGSYTEVMRIHDNGNVGIGTAAPGAPLQVNRSSNGINQYIYNTTSGQAYIAFGNATTGLFSQDFTSANGLLVGIDQDETAIIWNAEATRLRFGTSGTERMSIAAAGNVGIGTTNPGAKLAITQTTAAEGLRVDGASGGFALIVNGGTSYKTSLRNASVGNGYGGNTPPANGLIVEGNVGIGTNSPGAVLEVRASASSPFGALRLSTSSTKYWQFNTIYNTTNPDLFIAPNGGAATMTLQSTGNVGIGTTSPTHPLHVEGFITTNNSSNASGVLIRKAGSTIGFLGQSGGWVGDTSDDLGISGETGKNIRFYTNGSATERMRITAAGNVGIGTTSPSAAIHIQKSISGGFGGTIYNTQATGGFGLSVRGGNSSSEDALRVQNVGGTYLLNVKGDGNVGIGTTSPGAKLDVNSGISSSSIDVIKLTQATNGANKAAASLGLSIQNGGEATNASDLWFTTANGGSLSERMRITSTGKVGIGTTAPSDPLHISSGGTDDFIRIDNTDTFTGLWMNDSGTNNGWLVMSGYTDVASSGDFAIREYGVQTSLVIKQTTGNVGIGTVSPSSESNLSLGAKSTSEGGHLTLFKGTSNTHATHIDNYADSFRIMKGTDTSSSTVQFSLDHATGNAAFAGDVSLVDSKKLILGAGSDLQIYHNATDSVIENSTGDLYITNKADDKDIVFRTDDGSGGYATYFYLDGSTLENVFYKNVALRDSVKATFGNSNDLQIYHNGSNSYIDDTGTGDLYIRANNLRLSNADGSGQTINANNGGNVELFHNNSKKFETTSTGVEVTGKITNLTAGTGNLDAVNVQQLNNATTGTLVYKGTWSAAPTTTSVLDGAVSGGTIVIDAANPGISVGATITGTGISGTVTVSNIAADGITIAISSSQTIADGVTLTFTTVGGTPDLSQASRKVTGHYYICETAGAATPNGASTTPNEWAVGDWATFSDLTTDAWQKIDNSSVLSGAGTGGKVPVWSGSGTSVTLADAPITVSGNNVNFAGSIYANTIYSATNSAYYIDVNSTGVGLNTAGGATFAGSITTQKNDNTLLVESTNAGQASLDLKNTEGHYRVITDAGEFKIFDQTDSRTPFLINTLGNATFAGDVLVEDNLYLTDAGTVRGKIQLNSSDRDNLDIKAISLGSLMRFYTADTLALTLDASQNATFAGNITGTSAQFIDTTNPDGGGGAGEGGSLTVEGRRDGTANLISLRARDASAPTVALPDGQGGLIRWQGFDGTDFAQMGAISVVADGQAVANSDAPSKMIFYTTPDGSDALTTALTLDKSQNATFAGNVSLPDNKKLILGAGDDLQIFHDGSHSRIKDAGSGSLTINATDFVVNNSADTKNMIIAVDGGATTLFCDGAGKLATTSTGVSVTGGSSRFIVDSSTASAIDIGYYSSARTIRALETGGNNLRPLAILSQYFNVDSSGNATFAGNVDVRGGGSGYNSIRIVNNTTDDTNKQAGITSLNYANNSVSIMQYATNTNANTVYYGSADTAHSGISNHKFYVNADPDTPGSGHTQALHIASNTNATFAGNIGVGGTAASNGYMVDITPSSGNIIRSTRGSSVFGSYQSNNSDVYLGTISSNTFKIITNDTTAITIDNSQNATFAGEVTSTDDINALTKIVVGENATAEVRIKKTNTGSGKLSFYNNDGTSSTQQGYLSLDANEDFVMYSAANNENHFYAGGVLNSTQIGANTNFAGNVTLSSTAPILYLANTTSSTGKTWRLSSAANGNAYITQDGVIDAITLSHTSGNATFAGSIDTTAVNIKVGAAIHGTITSSSNSLTLNARNTGKMIFQSGGSEKMRINGSNVGIGTTDPKSKLHVNGGIQMGGDTAAASADKVGTMRYRTGTEYVEVDGVELVTNGDFASSTDWVLKNSASINNGTGVATVPGGGALGSTAANWSLSQASVFAPSTLYRVRFQARRDAGTASEMYVGQGYSLKFNQVLTSSWVQHEVVFTSTSNVGWSDLTFGGVVGTTSEVKEVSVMKVTSEDTSYADMCMQTGASTYEWVNIVRNTY